MWRCEWRCECVSVKMCVRERKRRCEYVKMWRCECVSVKMWRCEDVWQTQMTDTTIRRTLRSDALGKNRKWRWSLHTSVSPIVCTKPAMNQRKLFTLLVVATATNLRTWDSELQSVASATSTAARPSCCLWLLRILHTEDHHGGEWCLGKWWLRKVMA